MICEHCGNYYQGGSDEALSHESRECVAPTRASGGTILLSILFAVLAIDNAGLVAVGVLSPNMNIYTTWLRTEYEANRAMQDGNWLKQYVGPGGAADGNEVLMLLKAGISVVVDSNGIWNAPATAYNTSGTMGKLLNSAGAAADPLLNSVPGTYTAGTAGFALGSVTGIKARTDLIVSGAAVTLVSPVAASGSATVVTGDDYLSADGRGLSWSITGYAGPALDANAVVKFRISSLAAWSGAESNTVLEANAVAVQSGSTLTVTVSLTAVQTATLSASPPATVNQYRFQVSATAANGSKVMIIEGPLTAKKRL